MATNYDKICSHLEDTQDFKDYSVRFLKKLEGANVAGWKFIPGGSDHDPDPLNKRNVAPPQHILLIDWGKKNGKDHIEEVWRDPNNWGICLETVCDEEELDTIADRNFATKACPTYFCKKEKLLGRYKKKSFRVENIWFAYVQRRLWDLYTDKISETQERLRKAMLSALASDAFAQDKIAFHERCIIDEIKSVLLKFSPVAKPHMIKAAMDEFICHEVMES